MLSWTVLLPCLLLVTLLRKLSSTASGVTAPEPPRPFWDIFNLKLLVTYLQAGRHGTLHAFQRRLLASTSQVAGLNVKTISYAKPGSQRIFTVDCINIHALLATQFGDFDTGMRKHWFSPLLGVHSIFCTDGDQWQHSRGLIRAVLSREHVSDLTIVDKYSTLLLEKLAKSAESNTVVDVQPLFLEHTMNTSLEFLGIQEAGDTEVTMDVQEPRFPKAFETAQMAMVRRTILGGLYWLYDTASFHHACKLCRAVVRRSVDRAVLRAETPSETKRLGRATSLLDELTVYTKDTDRLTSMALDLMLAGRDTSAAFLSFVIYYLARHPSAYARLRCAVESDFGSADDPETVTFEKLKSCHYLQWVMHETLRLQPSTPLGIKEAVRDTTLPRGGGPDGMLPIAVPKGTEILYNFHLMHRDTEYWGADVEEWRPERFDRRKLGKDYLPFNGGPRACLGQQFALTSSAYTLVRICQSFERIEDKNGHETPRMTIGLVNMKLDGVKVRFHRSQS